MIKIKNTNNVFFDERHFKNVQIEIDGKIPQLDLHKDKLKSLCEEIAGYWDEEHKNDYVIDLTGLWIEFPKDWDEMDQRYKNEFIYEIEKIASKYLSDFGWTDFEIWLDNVEVVGWASVDTGKPNWFSWDGFECYDDFSRTNQIAETGEDNIDYLLRWRLIKSFVDRVDIKEELRNQTPRIVTYDATGGIKLKLYVNCSVHNREPDNYRFDDSLGCYVKCREW